MTRLAPYKQGEVARFRRRAPTRPALIVKAPDGLLLSIPAPNGVVDLWLPQVGTWLLRWEDQQEIQSVEVEIGEVDHEPEDLVETTISSSALPPMRVSVPPRH